MQASDSTTAAADSSWHEAPFPLAGAGAGGAGGGGGGGGEPLSQRSASELLALHRRCFSCCNTVLQQQACLVRGDERVMVSAVWVFRVFVLKFKNLFNMYMNNKMVLTFTDSVGSFGSCLGCWLSSCWY